MTHTPPQILFVCRQNACRSQMAEAFARRDAHGPIRVWSAGSASSGVIDPKAVTVMREEGVDLARHQSEGLTQLPRVTWDVVVTLGCEQGCPTVAARHHMSWDIPDPSGRPLAFYRQVRD